jgi:replicative DNA helicase
MNNDEVDVLLARAEKNIASISDKRIGINIQHIKEIALEVGRQAEEAKLRGNRTLGVPSSYREIDRATGGFKGGELILVAARPGIGKTAFALNLCHNIAKERWSETLGYMVSGGYKVGFFSLEMINPQLVLRMVAKGSGLNSRLIQTGQLDEQGWVTLNDTVQKISDTQIWFADTIMLTITKLAAQARRMVKSYGVEIIFVDYIQLIQGDGRNENRVKELGDISRTLKALAMELGVPIIAMAQLKRMEADQEPELHHLRESGNLEQDADVVLLLHRTALEQDGIPFLFPTQINIAKQRNGPSPLRVPFLFHAKNQTFEEYRSEPK